MDRINKRRGIVEKRGEEKKEKREKRKEGATDYLSFFSFFFSRKSMDHLEKFIGPARSVGLSNRNARSIDVKIIIHPESVGNRRCCVIETKVLRKNFFLDAVQHLSNWYFRSISVERFISCLHCCYEILLSMVNGGRI